MRGRFPALTAIGRAGRSALAALLVPACAGAAAAETQELRVDPAKSRVRIELGRSGFMKFLGHAHEIAAPIAEGRVRVVADDPARSSVEIAFESGRLAVVPGSEPQKDVPEVEARMRGPEVLDVSRFPSIRFRSRRVQQEQAGLRPASQASSARRLRVRGALELKGRTIELEIPLELARDAEGLTAKGETWLELRALGIEPPSVAGVVKVANRFRLSFEIRARP